MATLWRLMRWPLFASVMATGAAVGIAVAVWRAAGYDPDIWTEDEEAW